MTPGVEPRDRRARAPAGRRSTSTIEVVRLDADLPLPSYAHPGDAGADLLTTVDVTLAPGERAMVPTGVAIALPVGYVALVHPRSGLAARHGLSIVNAPGTVDAGYRGEIKVMLINHDPGSRSSCAAATGSPSWSSSAWSGRGSWRWGNSPTRRAGPGDTVLPEASVGPDRVPNGGVSVKFRRKSTESDVADEALLGEQADPAAPVEGPFDVDDLPDGRGRAARPRLAPDRAGARPRAAPAGGRVHRRGAVGDPRRRRRRGGAARVRRAPRR